jgi:hypothetical protein
VESLRLRRSLLSDASFKDEVASGWEVRLGNAEFADDSCFANPAVSSLEEVRDETKPSRAVVSTEIGERSTAAA